MKEHINFVLVEYENIQKQTKNKTVKDSTDQNWSEEAFEYTMHDIKPELTVTCFHHKHIPIVGSDSEVGIARIPMEKIILDDYKSTEIKEWYPVYQAKKEKSRSR